MIDFISRAQYWYWVAIVEITDMGTVADLDDVDDRIAMISMIVYCVDVDDCIPSVDVDDSVFRPANHRQTKTRNIFLATSNYQNVYI